MADGYHSNFPKVQNQTLGVHGFSPIIPRTASLQTFHSRAGFEAIHGIGLDRIRGREGRRGANQGNQGNQGGGGEWLGMEWLWSVYGLSRIYLSTGRYPYKDG